jgi:hypothetical protein
MCVNQPFPTLSADAPTSQHYTRALSSQLGQRVRAFYTTTSKQIFDIHEEARRIADEHKVSQQAHATGSDSAEIPAAAHPLDKEG